MDNWTEERLEKIRNLDLRIFSILSETTEGDKISLLRLQNVIRGQVKGYAYLEVGSHLGGALVPHLIDPRCRQVYSIDKRPLQQPDERGRDFYYRENSTERMLEGLRKELRPECMSKLITFDRDASDVCPQDVPAPADLVFIDAEHTNTAIFRDFLSVFRFCGPCALVALHDANLIGDGIQNIEEYLRFQKIPFSTLVLPENVAVIALGDVKEEAIAALTPFALDKESYFRRAKQKLWEEIAANTLYFKPESQ